MMMDVALEEEEGPVASSPMIHSGQPEDLLLTERARRLFKLCDHNGKGFIVKMDLARIDGMVPNVSQQQLELFFDNIDISKANYITENQFIDGIKPVILRSDLNGIHHNAIETDEENLDEEDEQMNLINENEESIHDELSTALENTEGGILDETDQLGGVVLEFAGSLEDELSLAKLAAGIETGESSVATATMEYPFTVENHNSMNTTASDGHLVAMGIRQTSTADELSRRERGSSNQLDLRKELYHSDLKTSLGSRSLADELREVGISHNHFPSSEPRPDFSPDRIFKVVFVGDSAVGKTCFLHRFCHNRFKPLFNATIGVDFTVKTIRLDNRVVAVQLWDTAGQERFRSITKQYFRKADGVIVMYDVTSEQSFLNVRNWIASVKAGVEESCVMCLVGNKVDLFGDDRSRVLTYKHGLKLAEEFGMLFFETSAFTGYGVNDCITTVATHLQEREDQQLEEALRLDMSSQSKARNRCCM